MERASLEYLQQPPEMNEPQTSAWDNYRRWRKGLYISILGLFVLGILGSKLPGSVTFLDFLPSELGVLLVFLPAFVSICALQHYKCPKCDRGFFYSGLWSPWAKHCVHCGLPKWVEANYLNPDSKQSAFRTRSISEMATAAAISTRERNSNFLILILRDDPGAIHLRLDSEGWADVNNLLTRANRCGFMLTRENLAEVLAVPGNQSIELDQPGNRIRWSSC